MGFRDLKEFHNYLSRPLSPSFELVEPCIGIILYLQKRKVRERLASPPGLAFSHPIIIDQHPPSKDTSQRASNMHYI
jgi:hypothetical protein